MSNETVPSWPRIEAIAREDGTGEVIVDGASYPVAEQDLDRARVAIIGKVTETAERLGRPVRVSTDGPDGHWPLVVHPNGHVAADDSAGTPVVDGSSATAGDQGVEPGVPTLPTREAYDGSPVPQSPRTALRPSAQPAGSQTPEPTHPGDGSQHVDGSPAAEGSQADKGFQQVDGGSEAFGGPESAAAGDQREDDHWDQDREDDSLVGELLAGDPPKPDSAVEVTESRRLDWKSVWEPSDRWNLRRTKKDELPKLRFHDTSPSTDRTASAAVENGRPDRGPAVGAAPDGATVGGVGSEQPAAVDQPADPAARPAYVADAAGPGGPTPNPVPVWETSGADGIPADDGASIENPPDDHTQGTRSDHTGTGRAPSDDLPSDQVPANQHQVGQHQVGQGWGSEHRVDPTQVNQQRTRPVRFGRPPSVPPQVDPAPFGQQQPGPGSHVGERADAGSSTDRPTAQAGGEPGVVQPEPQSESVRPEPVGSELVRPEPGQPDATRPVPQAADGRSQAPAETPASHGPQQRQSFLVHESAEEPASRGFRGFLSRAGFKVGPSELERSERNDMMAVSQHWPGPRTIAIVNGKGGAGKTPSTILLSAVFALFGGAGVAAWDNNQTRGTLGWRTEPGGHDATLLDLLPEVPRLLSTGAQAADLAHFVHHQTRDRFDVLRSQPMVLAHEQRIEPRDVDAIHSVLGKYYRLIFIDSGNDESDPMWLRMIDHADQLVVATTTRNDHAEAGALLLEALAARDERSARLAEQSVAVITQADSNATGNDVRRVQSGYQPLTRATVAIPFDPGMVDGQLQFGQLKRETQRAWLAAGAAVAHGL